MKKIVFSTLMVCSCAATAGMDSLSISGFGSVSVGKSNNDVGYAGYTSERFDTKQDTLAGIQFDFEVNDRAKFTAQLVANGRYDFEPSVEVAYLSYDFQLFTARAGKMRTPLFMYSDYLDVGYAFPMIRPSQEMYEHLIINSYTGGDLLIPVDIGETTLQLQPYAGISQVEERDSSWGEADFNKTFGLTAHWYIDDLTLRAAYASGHSDYSAPATLINPPGSYAEYILDDKKAKFMSMGAQFDNGVVLAVFEAMRMEDTGRYADIDALSGLAGYRFGDFMPYFAVNWSETTDNEKRETPVPGFEDLTNPLNLGLFAYEKGVNNFERIAYSLGARWDFASNIALKLDGTFVDYRETTGGFKGNFDLMSGTTIENDSIVYSATLDFVF